VSPAEWPDSDPVRDSGPVNRLADDAGSSWPTRIGGYAKLLVTAVTTIGATGVLQWLQSAGVTSLPAWAIAGITAVVGMLTIMFGPRNKA
jgi:hypothetical protein